jgi:hypothetical protein
MKCRMATVCIAHAMSFNIDRSVRLTLSLTQFDSVAVTEDIG